MSGGHFNYDQHRVRQIADDIQHLIDSNKDETLNELGDKNGQHYPTGIIDKFKEAAHTLNQAAAMAQRVDWLVSGDDGEESFLARWEKEVPDSWSNTT